MPDVAVDTTGNASSTTNTTTVNNVITNNNNEIVVLFISPSGSTNPTVSTVVSTGLTFKKVSIQSLSSGLLTEAWAAFVTTAQPSGFTVTVTTTNNSACTVVWASVKNLNIVDSTNPENFIAQMSDNPFASTVNLKVTALSQCNNSLALGVCVCGSASRVWTAAASNTILQDKEVTSTRASHSALVRLDALNANRGVSSTFGATLNTASAGNVVWLEFIGQTSGYCYKRSLFNPSKVTTNSASVATSTKNLDCPAGATIIVEVFFDLASATSAVVSSVTDDAGNTYVQDVAISNTTGNVRAEIWRASNIAQLNALAQITVNFSTTVVNTIHINAELALRLHKTSPLNGTSTSQGTGGGSGATVGSGSITTTQANDLLFGIGGVGSSNNITINSSWTEIFKSTSGKTSTTGYRQLEATETRAFQFTQTSQQYIAAIAAYKEDITATATESAIIASLESTKSKNVATLSTLQATVMKNTALLSSLQGNKVLTYAIKSILQGNTVRNTALKSVLELVQKQVVATLSTLEGNKARNTAVKSLLESVQRNIIAQKTTLEGNKAKNMALFPTLEKITKRTTALNALLENVRQRNMAISTILEVLGTDKYTIALLSGLEKNTVLSSALLGLLEVSKKKTYGVNAILEETRYKTTATRALLEGVRRKTVSVASLLESTKKKTLPIQALLESVKYEVLAVSSTLEETLTEVLAIKSVLEGNKIRTFSVFSPLEANVSYNIALASNFVLPPLVYNNKDNYVRDPDGLSVVPVGGIGEVRFSDLS